MQIFQKSVIQEYINNLDNDKVDEAYEIFRQNYNKSKVDQVKKLKEEEYQDGFLRDIFVDVLGYTLRPSDNYNLQREFKNQTDGKKADAAILKDDHAIGIIELKSTKTKDLTKITQQAFYYKNNQPECKFIITSNFQKLRFYIDYSNEYEEFDLFSLDRDKFNLLYLILHKDNIFNGIPIQLKKQTQFHEEEVSGQLYNDYSIFKNKLFNNLTLNHPEQDKLLLFKKSQKLLDRFLFILFAEDSGLLPANSISRMIKRFEILKDEDAYKPIYEIFKQYFGYMNIGRKGKKSADDIPAYNGGLFYEDQTLAYFTIDDDVLIKDLKKLSTYDFNSEVDVNILGHIFEHSLNEIEEVTADIEGKSSDQKHSKRKKDGVYYTPKYITTYIVANTVGKLCIEKKKELDIEEIEFDESFLKTDGNLTLKGKKLLNKLTTYKTWLTELKIVDPACGSGAFLNQALNFLIEEHKKIDDIIAELKNTPLRFFDTDKNILENNLFGVDINEESVEIAQLSLWLRTAKKDRKLSKLNKNIKCGNSLLQSEFDWKKEFPQVFKEKDKKLYHITTAVHDSRTSKRMEDYNVRERRQMGAQPNPNIVYFTKDEDYTITQTLAEIVKADKINLVAYNICADHMHLLLACNIDEIPQIMQKIKSITAKKINDLRYNRNSTPRGNDSLETKNHIPRGHDPLGTKNDSLGKENYTPRDHDPVRKKNDSLGKYKPVWSQKYSAPKEITSTDQLQNTISYIQKNRSKHQLPEHESKIKSMIEDMCCSVEEAIEPEYTGGFDVVIGNPPYIKEYTNKQAFDGLRDLPSYQGKMDLWYMFGDLALDIVKKDAGLIGYIAPNNWITNSGASKFRNLVLQKGKLIEFIDFGDFKVFDSAGIQTMIYIMQRTDDNENYNFSYSKVLNSKIKHEDAQLFLEHLKDDKYEYFKAKIDKRENLNQPINFVNAELTEILDKIRAKQNFKLDKKEVAQGIVPNPDVVNSRNISKFTSREINENNIEVGQGVFVIDKNLIKNSNYIKPLFEPENFERYYHNPEFVKELIYIPKGEEPETQVLEHLNKFRPIMEDRRENKSGSILYYNLHWPRNEKFFKKGGKIISLRKCTRRPVFSYTENDCYVMLSFNVIKTEQLNLKYLTALLNSDLMAFWLKYKGKMQGSNYQIDKAPLLYVPIFKPHEDQQNELTDLVNHIISHKQKQQDYQKLLEKAQSENNFDREIQLTKALEQLSDDFKQAESKINSIIFELYELDTNDIEIIKKQIHD